MSSGNQTRTRSEHVAQLELPPSRVTRAISLLRRGDVTLRILLCVLAALLIWVFTAGWSVRLPYRTGMTPERDIIARQSFERDDEEQTAAARESARRSVECVYDHDVQRVNELRQRLKDRILQLISAPLVCRTGCCRLARVLAPAASGHDGKETGANRHCGGRDPIRSRSTKNSLPRLPTIRSLRNSNSSIERLFEPISRFWCAGEDPART